MRRLEVQVIENDRTVYIDCDDTLVMWPKDYKKKKKGRVKCIDHYNKTVNYLIPHKKHINLLKAYKGRGFFCVAWTAAGSLWFLEVIKQLKLEKYVDLVITKPEKYVDDLDSSVWIGPRVYLK
jgi:hypothetical protein